MQSETDADFLPAHYLALYQQRPPPATGLFRGPLPTLTHHHYTTGGCWILALALNETTGLPIELYHRDGLPQHAYIVDGDRAIDAWGRRELQFARAGAETTSRVTREELLALLPTLPPHGTLILQDTERPSCRDAARRTAAFVLKAAGWPPRDAPTA